MSVIFFKVFECVWEAHCTCLLAIVHINRHRNNCGPALLPYWDKDGLQKFKKMASARLDKSKWLSRWQQNKGKYVMLREVEATSDPLKIDDERFLERFSQLYRSCKDFREMLMVRAMDSMIKKMVNPAASASEDVQSFSAAMASQSPAIYAWFRSSHKVRSVYHLLHSSDVMSHCLIAASQLLLVSIELS